MKWKRLMKVTALSAALCLLLSSAGLDYQTVHAAETEEPVLTIACLSDLHNQMSLIEGDVSNVRLRGVVDATLQAVKDEEEIDMMILCGDYTSDSTDIPKENWLKIRQLMVDATRYAFPDDATEYPVLWVDGNHDYEITREYNAGDYYTYPMKEDIGELPPEDSFYEWTYDGKYELLAAYYYELYGFDFLCLNTGNFIYDNPNGSGYYTGYEYSLESVEWVKQKLDEIYADNPNKTVFFITHIPFDDSNSINKGKGMDENAESTKLLKKTLAEHPNLIHLYGHDHGKDTAYIRSDTAQRVTQYDINGEKISNEKISPFWRIISSDNGYIIQNTAKDEFLGYGNDNLQLSADDAQSWEITKTGELTWKIQMPGIERPNLYFSTSSRTFSANQVECELGIYEQISEEDGTYHFEPAAGVSDEGTYAIVSHVGDSYYLFTNEDNDATGIDLRMIPTTVDALERGFDYREKGNAKPSFITSFVGSMRYYSSSIDGGSSPDDSKVVQALMVYVYRDRVELQMKNYGSYQYYDQPYPGNPSIVISRYLKPYITYRKVINNYADTEKLESTIEEMDRISLKGYNAESIRAFMKELAEAKTLLEEQPRSSKQQAVDKAVSNLENAKKGLKPASAVKPPETEKETQKEEPQVQPSAQNLKRPVLKAVKKGKNKVKLSWNRQTAANGYLVQMKKGKAGYQTLKKITANSKVSVTTGKLKKGTYKFRVRAYNKSVTGAWSRTVTVKL